MDAAEIRRVIRTHLLIVDGSLNQRYLDAHDGLFRGLIWALTGSDPGSELTTNTLRLCRLAGIPAEASGRTVLVGDLEDTV
jgi:hypothetical protein